VELNESVTVDSQRIFCKTGDMLAIRFLVASRDAVILAGAAPPQDVAWRVEATLAEMLVHRAKCHECHAAEFLAHAG
jgi:mono/diheme cytochrome c family protein